MAYRGWDPRKKKAGPRKRLEGSKLGAMRKITYVCDGCGVWLRDPKKQKSCIGCGRMDFIKFDSEIEAKRWAILLLLQKQGLVTSIRRQVRYMLFAHHPKLGAVKVGEYIADFVYGRYRDDGTVEPIIEDVKPDGMTDLADWKIRHMAAQGQPVKIVTMA